MGAPFGSKNHLVHGLHNTPTYYSWVSMKSRCTNKNRPDYFRYGGRGIVFCESWGEFENFLSDMGVRPEGLQLERINNDGNYEPSNCRWASVTEQARNRRKRSDNKTGVVGVTYCQRGKYFMAEVQRDKILTRLYLGKDYFEAVCARKSWDARN